MYERIMVAIDNDFAQDRVLASAIELARLCTARLAVCHALDDALLSNPAGEVWLAESVEPAGRQLANSAQSFLDEAAEIARAAGIDVEVRLVRSSEANAAERIANAATEWRADLLVAGAHNRRGIERFFVGSFAEQLVSKAGTTLLLVRAR